MYTDDILVFTSSTSCAFRAVMRGIGHAAQQRHWSVRAIDISKTKTSISDMIREWHPHAALTYYLDAAAFPEGLPAVHINPLHETPDSLTVRHDSAATGRLAAKELLGIGMEHFAFVGTHKTSEWSQTRHRAFAASLAEHGAKCLVPEPHIRRSDPVSDQRAIANWMKSLPLPCGIFAANDRLADLVVAAAKSAHLNIPDQLAVIGADNDEQVCENASVTITSIAPDFIRGGTLACELLENRISPSRQYGDLGVIRRASTRRLRRPSIMVSELQEYIRRQASSGISAIDVIARAKCSRRTAELAFRAATGHSIGQELANIRLDLTVLHLADPTVRIGEIPGLVGYLSQNQLERIFRRKTGLTMRDYRATGRSDSQNR